MQKVGEVSGTLQCCLSDLVLWKQHVY